MLLGYGARNCWCFKDWMQVDLKLDGSVPADISMNLPAATAMCFKGSNASGKTNGLKVLAFIKYFAQFSFQSKPEDMILFDPFFFQNEEARFYIEFLQNNCYYRYELTATPKAVVSEGLVRKKLEEGSRETEIFRREGNAVTKNTLYRGHSGILFRDNASFICTLKQYNLPEIDDIYAFFFQIIVNVAYTGLSNRIHENPFGVSEFYSTRPEHLAFASRMIERFDTGINRIEIKTKTNEYNQIFHYPVFYHQLESGKNLPLLYDAESSGTKALFGNLMNYYDVLSLGGVLVLDEFDINLHPDILPHLLDLFLVKDNNPLDAQLLFTSHNTEIMDILGRYRTYIFEKEGNESFCYRLDEPKAPSLRNDRPVSVPYRKHLIGGFPRIDSDKK